MSETRSLDCAGCGAKLTISAPAPEAWDPITAPDLNQPGRKLKVVGYRITVRCPDPTCGTRTAIERQDDPQGDDQ